MTPSPSAGSFVSDLQVAWSNNFGQHVIPTKHAHRSSPRASCESAIVYRKQTRRGLSVLCLLFCSEHAMRLIGTSRELCECGILQV